MNKSGFFILASFTFLSTCGVESKKENSSGPEAAAVKTILKTYYDDMSRRDWQAYRSRFWNSATITTAWKQPGDSVTRVHVITIDDFVKETRNGPDSQPIFEERMTDAQIIVKGNLAEVWARYEAKFGKPDSLRQWKGTDLFTLLRHRGEWKIVSLVFESD